MELNKFSKQVTQDDTQPAAQAMLHAIGLTNEDFLKPLVGIASTGYEGNPCNMHLNDLAKLVKEGEKERRFFYNSSPTQAKETRFLRILSDLCGKDGADGKGKGKGVS